MRVLAGLLLLTTAAAADEGHGAEPFDPSISVGGGLSLAVERNLAVMIGVELAFPVRDNYWIAAAVGIGDAGLKDPAGSGQGDSSAYEGRVGFVRLSCGSRACTGLVGSVGFHHQAIEFDDGLVDPPMWTEVRDLAFGEARAFGRLNIGPVSLEAALGARIYGALHTERTKGGLDGGVIASLGLHLTL
jgi:hypothetical protein